MKFNSKLIITIVIAAVALVGVGGAYFFYTKYRETNTILNNPEAVAAKDQKELLDKLGKIVELPKDETPSIATVLDTSKFKDQPFFANAQNGDKVIVYSKAKIAILFRPSTNKVIIISPVTTTPTETGGDATKSASVKVNILNGTNTAGLTLSAASKLESLPNITVAERLDANKKDYANTVVFDIGKVNAAEAQNIASVLGGQVVDTLPDGEVLPLDTSVNILVILGTDFK